MVVKHLFKRLAGRRGNLVVERSRAHSSTFTAASDVEPFTSVVTLMSVDMTGFARLAEQHPAKHVFATLGNALAGITELVKKHGGTVNRYFSDGLVCVFADRKDHPDEALRCAIEIQRHAAAAYSREGSPVSAVRIGIHTAAMQMGTFRGAPMLVGHGLAFAERLHQACEIYSILVSAPTRDMLANPDSHDIRLVGRTVEIAQRAGHVDVYQCDPLAGQPTLRKAAAEFYRLQNRRRPRAQRWDVPESIAIAFHSSMGEGLIVNFSGTGLAVRMTKAPKSGSKVELSFDPIGGSEAKKMSSIKYVADVRWVRQTDTGRSLVGLELKALSKAEREELVWYLRWRLVRGASGSEAA